MVRMESLELIAASPTTPVTRILSGSRSEREPEFVPKSFPRTKGSGTLKGAPTGVNQIFSSALFFR